MRLCVERDRTTGYRKTDQNVGCIMRYLGAGRMNVKKSWFAQRTAAGQILSIPPVFAAILAFCAAFSGIRS
jgi:hypothetical protein